MLRLRRGRAASESHAERGHDYTDSMRVTMRAGNMLPYLLGDHLGSASVTSNGVATGKLRYYLFYNEPHNHTPKPADDPPR